MVGAGDGSTLVDYRVLSAQMRDAGLMRRRSGWYAVRMGVSGAALAGGWAAAVALRGSWPVLAVAAWLGVASVQVVFIGHDAGHQQIFRSRVANRLVGLVAGNALTGLCFGWWVPKHNAHHAHPNQLDHDPDIGRGVFAFTTEAAAGRRGLAGALVRHQALTFFPLLTLEGMALRVAGVRELLRGRTRHVVLESALLVAHAAAYIAAVCLILPPGRAIAFVAVQQGVFGLYLGCSFAPNHIGMTVIERDSAEPFVVRQILTSRNISGGWFVAVVFGGLNHQIEHHLFPSMARPNLRRAEPIVRRFCAAYDLPYEVCGIALAYREAVVSLRAVGSG
jgi:fatty acid desaturase